MATRRRHRDKTKKSRLVISFFLYVFIAIFSLSCCNIAVIANNKKVADIFTGYYYIQSVRDDISQYAKDRCIEAGIPDTFVDKTITYDQVNHLQESFIYNRMNVGATYNDSAFDAFLEEYNELLNKNMRKMIDEQSISSDSKKNINSFCDDITSYTRNKIEFKLTTQMKSIVQKARLASYALLVLSIIGIIVLSITLLTKGAKDYRVTRNFAYSFLSAGILDLFLVFAGVLVKATKDLVIYPLYLARSVMSYYNDSLLAVAYAGMLLFLASLVFACLTWKFKRQEKE